MYQWDFVRKLRRKALAKLRDYPDVAQVDAVARSRTFWEFDDRFTAPLHGFAGTDDYWRRACAKPHMQHIQIPALVVNARNAPFVPGRSLASPRDVGAYVTLWQPADGGQHAFFVVEPAGADEQTSATLPPEQF